MHAYLTPGHHIDSDEESVRAKAAELAAGCPGEVAVADACFRFVRDEIRHSGDWGDGPVTCRASEVLRHGTGYCYAKSHLLAALLRANGIPAGLCYQRLSVGDSGPPYCLHGLVAVHLQEFGWYRCDPRGNKPGVDARFCPPQEQLAFLPKDPQERDLPGILSHPRPEVVAVLESCTDVHDVLAHLPDAPG